jgi:hypothetical protein
MASGVVLNAIKRISLPQRGQRSGSISWMLSSKRTQA